MEFSSYRLNARFLKMSTITPITNPEQTQNTHTCRQIGVIGLKMTLVSHSPEKYGPSTSLTLILSMTSAFSPLSSPLLSSTLPLLSLIMFYIFTFQANCGACGYLMQHSLFPYVTPLHIVCSKRTLQLHY